MSISNVNTAVLNNVRWFNAHTEACGYLNGLKEITPKPGQDFKPFWVSTFCMYEGNPQKPRKTFINVNIVNLKLVDILKPYANQLNTDQSKVWVTARISDLTVEPFIYGNNSNLAGQLGVNWQANLISLIALKVGDMAIDLKQATTTDFGVPVQQPAAAQSNSPSLQSSNSQNPFGLPLLVTLQKNDPNFSAAKDRLKQQGYRWSNDKLAWCLANIKLEKSDPAFNEKYHTLKNAGYVFSKANAVWNLPSAPKPLTGNYQNTGNCQQSGFQQ